MKIQLRRVQLLFFILIMLVAAGCGANQSNDVDGTEVAETEVAEMEMPATATTLPAPEATMDLPAEPSAAASTETATEMPTEPPAEIATQPAAALHVVFINEGNVWLWQMGAEATPLTQSGDTAQPQISDDGALVAFSRNGELWVVAADGSNEQRLIGSDMVAQMGVESGVTALHLYDWLPSTHRLLFNTRNVGTMGSSANDDLHAVDAETLAYQQLLPAGQGGEFYPAPNGQQIALVTPDMVSIINADGSNYQAALVSYERIITYSEFLYYPRANWASDSSVFTVAIPPTDPFAQPAGNAAIWRVPVNGEAAQLIGELNSEPFQRVFAFSPDLRHVAYIAPLTETELAAALAVTDLQSGEVVARYAAVVMIYGWSLDGGYLAFLQGNEGPLAQIAALGQAPQAVASDAAATLDVQWVEPDQYLYVAQGPDGWEIKLGNVNGESQRVALVNSDRPSFATNR